MWSALTRETGEAIDAMNIASRSAIQGSVSGVRQSGRRRETTMAAAHAPNASSTAVSRLLIDWCGSRTSGSVSSNGAASVSSATPAKRAISTGISVGRNA